jgi:hypothetical protein
MTLRNSTLTAAADPHRFVHPWAAKAFLDQHRRASLLRRQRKLRAAIVAIADRVAYGTDDAVEDQRALAVLIDQLRLVTEELPDAPTPGEARMRRTTHYDAN